jgi:hypothetical protein
VRTVVPFFRRCLQRQASPNIVIALAGNKADLASKRQIEYDVRASFAFDAFFYYFLTSEYVHV